MLKQAGLRSEDLERLESEGLKDPSLDESCSECSCMELVGWCGWTGSMSRPTCLSKSMRRLPHVSFDPWCNVNRVHGNPQLALITVNYPFPPFSLHSTCSTCLPRCGGGRARAGRGGLSRALASPTALVGTWRLGAGTALPSSMRCG